MTSMATSHRSTIYFESDVLRALKLKSATTDTPVSSIVNDALRKIIWRGVNGGYYMEKNFGLSFPAETPDMSLSQAHLFFQIQNGETGTIIAPAPFTNGEYAPAPWQKS